jgi:hypothetical protein
MLQSNTIAINEEDYIWHSSLRKKNNSRCERISDFVSTNLIAVIIKTA